MVCRLAVERIADGERVFRSQLKVEAGADVEARLRIGDGHGVVVGVAGGVEQLGVDDGVGLVVAAEDAAEPRTSFVKRAASVSHEKSRVVRGLAGDEGVERIECGVVAAHHERAVQFVGAGLGEDLNAPVAELVVLRREGILVDADFADG